jgi:hypothetical protein
MLNARAGGLLELQGRRVDRALVEIQICMAPWVSKKLVSAHSLPTT